MIRYCKKSSTLAELAEIVSGEVIGDATIIVDRVAPINLASAGSITFVSNPKYVSALATTDAAAVIISPKLGYEGDKPCIVVDNPYLAFAKILTHLAVERPDCQGVSDAAVVAPTAQIASGVTVSANCSVGENAIIGKGTYIGPGVTICGNVTLGENCLVHPGVVIREGCRIGDRVILQPNAVIGSDGFGFAPDGEGYYKIPQVGIVVLEDDVEIGASSCVDRAAMGETVIKKGTKIDNLVQIGHNVVIGEHSILVSQVGIAGSTVVGKHCTFGGQSGSVGHVKIGDNVTVVARGAVSSDVEGNQFLAGFPIMSHKEWLKSSSGFQNLSEMRKELNRMRKKIEALEQEMKES